MPRRRRWRGAVHAGIEHQSPNPTQPQHNAPEHPAMTLPATPPLQRDLGRLGLVILGTLVLLAGVVWLGQTTTYLTEFGQTLYAFLGF
ncbi:hypothetical protein HY374_03640 [Candidatus Berkelbacteria bacterium]|nr:hypothetical protein [Candidatus Berkelbacteria bacterium]